MEENKVTEQLPVTTDQAKEIAEQIVAENDPDKLKALTQLFNVALLKKNAVRSSKLSELYDNIVDKATERVVKRGDEMDHDTLLKYMQTVEQQLNRASTNVEAINEAPTVINNTEVNVTVNQAGGIDRESREKVLDAISAILKMAGSDNDNVIDAEYTEVKGDNNE